jgi:WD40 repeat protein/tRNA A-37 threonylcarbamoyl transferase component Bud32
MMPRDSSTNVTQLRSKEIMLNDRYRILEQVGQGGFGSVYKAMDSSFGGRLVAIKAMEQKGLSSQEIAEAATGFKGEALMLANLRNPHLPRIYDHFSDSGRWYLVMDYIEGETLELYLQKSARSPHTGKGHLPVMEALDIGLQLCDVLEYLHTRQPPIIFRDLKPANIMRTPEKHLYLIDFGIARHFKPGQVKDTIPLGSPGYAAPEQYGKVQTTPRADIYSLGVILHQSLTGDDPTNTPFLLAHIQLGGDPALAKLALLIKSMTEIDESHRSASAAAVRDELQHIRAGQSNQRVLWSLPPLETGVNRFSSASEGTAASQSRQRQVFADQPARGRQEGRSPRRISRRALLVGGTAIGAAMAGLGIWDVYARQGSFNLDILLNATKMPTANGNSYTYTGHSDAVISVGWSPDGAHIASASADKTVQVYDAATGSHILTYSGHSAGVTGVGWSPDSSRLVSTGLDSTVQMWDASTGKQLHQLGPQQNQTIALTGPIYGGAWSTEVQRIATAVDGYLNLIDSETWQSLGGGTGPIVMAPNVLSWAPHDPLIAVAEQDHSVYTWGINTEIGGASLVGHTRKVVAVDWSPDGGKLVSGAQDNTVRVWSIPPMNQSATLQGNNLFVYRGHTDWVLAVAWSPDGNKIASAGRDKTVQVWNAATGQLHFTYTGHSAPVNSLAWSLDSTFIASASDDKTVQVWRVG